MKNPAAAPTPHTDGGWKPSQVTTETAAVATSNEETQGVGKKKYESWCSEEEEASLLCSRPGLIHQDS